MKVKKEDIRIETKYCFPCPITGQEGRIYIYAEHLPTKTKFQRAFKEETTAEFINKEIIESLSRKVM